jgi:hypothetical protein
MNFVDDSIVIVPPLPMLSPGPPLTTDLSASIKTDTSGVSKRNSAAEESQEITAILNDRRRLHIHCPNQVLV